MKVTPKKLSSSLDASRGYKNKKDALKDLVFYTSITVALLLLTSFALSFAGLHLPDSVEKSLSFSTVYQSSDVEKKLPLQSKAVREEFSELVKNNSRRDLNYKLEFIESDHINAFAMLGGTVVVTDKLLENIKDPAAITFVLGHEIGHHELRHVTKKLTSSGTLSLLKSSIFGSDSFGSLIDALSTGAMMAYSRQDELEADTYAAELLVAKYGDLKGAEVFFMALSKEEVEDTASSSQIDFFSTHPLTTGRIKALKLKFRNSSK